jgi:hypothetical protein
MIMVAVPSAYLIEGQMGVTVLIPFPGVAF